MIWFGTILWSSSNSQEIAYPRTTCHPAHHTPSFMHSRICKTFNSMPGFEAAAGGPWAASFSWPG